MPVVTHHPTNSPGTTLLKHEQELMIAHPHLSPGHVRQLVRDQHPDLWRLHHQGIADPADAAPTIDPGEVLNRRAYVLQQTNAARSFAEGLELAARELPEHWAAWHSGLRMPAGQVRQGVEPSPRRRSSDAGTELLHLVQERIAADPAVTIADAQRAVLAADPQLARCYAQATPLPMTKPKTVTETLVERALVEHRRLEAEIARLQGTTRHYNDLADEEKNRLPLRQHERRLRPGEKLRSGETMCEKMGAADVGGGSFAVARA